MKKVLLFALFAFTGVAVAKKGAMDHVAGLFGAYTYYCARPSDAHHTNMRTIAHYTVNEKGRPVAAGQVFNARNAREAHTKCHSGYLFKVRNDGSLDRK